MIIAGNWKMNKTPKESVVLANLLKDKVSDAECDVIFCVPFVDLYPVLEAVKGTNIKVGAQNMYFEDKGAFTGEISADMLVELGVEYVIIGHSERRAYFGETDQTVNLKLKKAIEKGLSPIVCVGESLVQQESRMAVDVIRIQIKGAFRGLSAEDVSKVVVAYEPIWAIGTGKTASSRHAGAMCRIIRETIRDLYDEETANKVRIQYGGSVNSANAAEILGQDDIDGALVGGASLKEEFEKIVNYKKEI